MLLRAESVSCRCPYRGCQQLERIEVISIIRFVLHASYIIRFVATRHHLFPEGRLSIVIHPILKNDSAENSIMQTITIAVSAILIAAGLVTAPGLINNARDNNATGDLANIAYAEAAVESNSTIMAFDNHPDSTYRLLENPGEDGSAVKFTTSGYQKNKNGAGRILVSVQGNNWVGFTKSSSGKVFMRTSQNSNTVLVTDESRAAVGFAPLLGSAATFGGVSLPAGFSAAVATKMYEAVSTDVVYDFTQAGTVPAPAGIGGAPVTAAPPANLPAITASAGRFTSIGSTTNKLNSGESVYSVYTLTGITTVMPETGGTVTQWATAKEAAITTESATILPGIFLRHKDVVFSEARYVNKATGAQTDITSGTVFGVFRNGRAYFVVVAIPSNITSASGDTIIVKDADGNVFKHTIA